MGAFSGSQLQAYFQTYGNNLLFRLVSSVMRLAIIFLLISSVISSARGQNIAVVDASVYTSPEAAAQNHATVLILNGKIASVGSHVRVPAGTRVLPCKGCVVFAGFWNDHVHFTGAQWVDAAHLPAPLLAQQLRDMLTHAGFTTVVDTASFPENTLALRRRIESGEVPGPKIYTSGLPLFPPQGVPYYLDDMPEVLRARLPQPRTQAAAVEVIQQNVSLGTDLVKLFTGSSVTPDHIDHMSSKIAVAAVSEGHRHGQLVFAHPSDLEGMRIAIERGVDVLAHAPDRTDGVDDALLARM